MVNIGPSGNPNDLYIEVLAAHWLGKPTRSRWASYPLPNQISVNTAAQRDAGHRDTWLQTFLNDLGFKGFGIGGSLAHGNPDNKGDGVHVFLGGHHRPYSWDREGDFAERLQRFAVYAKSDCITDKYRES